MAFNGGAPGTSYWVYARGRRAIPMGSRSGDLSRTQPPPGAGLSSARARGAFPDSLAAMLASLAGASSDTGPLPRARARTAPTAPGGFVSSRANYARFG